MPAIHKNRKPETQKPRQKGVRATPPRRKAQGGREGYKRGRRTKAKLKIMPEQEKQILIDFFGSPLRNVVPHDFPKPTEKSSLYHLRLKDHADNYRPLAFRFRVQRNRITDIEVIYQKRGVKGLVTTKLKNYKLREETIPRIEERIKDF